MSTMLLLQGGEHVSVQEEYQEVQNRWQHAHEARAPFVELTFRESENRCSIRTIDLVIIEDIS